MSRTWTWIHHKNLLHTCSHCSVGLPGPLDLTPDRAPGFSWHAAPSPPPPASQGPRWALQCSWHLLLLPQPSPPSAVKINWWVLTSTDWWVWTTRGSLPHSYNVWTTVSIRRSSGQSLMMLLHNPYLRMTRCHQMPPSSALRPVTWEWSVALWAGPAPASCWPPDHARRWPLLQERSHHHQVSHSCAGVWWWGVSGLVQPQGGGEERRNKGASGESDKACVCGLVEMRWWEKSPWPGGWTYQIRKSKALLQGWRGKYEEGIMVCPPPQDGWRRRNRIIKEYDIFDKSTRLFVSILIPHTI